MSQKNKVRQGEKKGTPETLKGENPLITRLKIVSGLIATIAAAVAIVNGCLGFQKDIREMKATLTPAPTITATTTPLFTPGPIHFIELPKQVKAGENVKVTLQAWDGATCYLEFFTADGNISKATGLGIAIPDGFARCTWVWKVNTNTHPGIGKLIFHLGDLEETHKLEVLLPN